ncbi:MAG: hypothetical protein ACM3PT_11960 [Deltaproteobacteria bacterium]
MKRVLILLFIAIPITFFAQKIAKPSFSVSIFNNATMLPPASITAVFDQPIHPGIMFTTEFGWKEKTKGKWFQNANLAYFYHELANHSFLIFSQAGYRRYFGRFTLEGSLNTGYMHCISLVDRIVTDKTTGKYKESKGIGRPQFIFGAGTAVGYRFNTGSRLQRVFLAFDIRMQMPFVKSYVTILPNGALSIGCQFKINKG